MENHKKMQEYIFPKKIVLGACETSGNLLKKQPLQIGLAEQETSLFEKDSFVVLDFGKEMNGGIRILTYKATNISVRIRFGESLTECCAELKDKTNAICTTIR